MARLTKQLTRQAKVEKIIEIVKPLLRLNGWNIKVKFVKIPHHRADCEASPEYTEAIVRFDLSNISEDDLVPFVVHELLHCVVWRLAHAAEQLTTDEAKLEWVRVEEEYLTTQLEQIIVPLVRNQIETHLNPALKKRVS